MNQTGKTGTNYDKMAADAAALFLRYDQESMIQKWELDADVDYIYVPFFSEENKLKIDRRSGRVYKIHDSEKPDGEAQSLNWEAMILYDLLTFSGRRPCSSGVWASIPELGGVIGAGHDSSLRAPLADAFSGKAGELAARCREAGGLPMERGDVSFVFTVFRDFRIWMQFWDADDEFPASVTFLFDRNAPAFMHYETLWYVMNALEKRLMDR